MNPLISIVIPVKNGEASIKACLDGIFTQTLNDKLEVIIIDSGSTDGTLELVKQYPVRLYQILSSEFNHGATRNLGVTYAKGEFVVMTVQDARPRDNKWLELMMEHFSDPEVAGVCGGQCVPHEPDKNPHEWYRPTKMDGFISYQFKKNEFDKLTNQQVRSYCGWDDVNAIYRKSILEAIPFLNVSYGEDFVWAYHALKNGYNIVYDSRAKVYHYHHASFDYQFKKTLTVLYFNYKYFNFLKIYNFQIKEYFLIIYRNIKYRTSIKWIIYNFKIYSAKWLAYDSFKKKMEASPESIDNYYYKRVKSIPQAKQKILKHK
jgi:rhamnosyltransferase